MQYLKTLKFASDHTLHVLFTDGTELIVPVQLFGAITESKLKGPFTLSWKGEVTGTRHLQSIRLPKDSDIVELLLTDGTLCSITQAQLARIQDAIKTKHTTLMSFRHPDGCHSCGKEKANG